MLTGPVTILQWSFVRDDQPRSETCRQIALAVRRRGPRSRSGPGSASSRSTSRPCAKGCPSATADRAAYLDWATACFQVATAAVADATQIHTHMCYAEFGDIMDAVVALDVDVISIEAARSQMDLLTDLAAVDYRAGIGLGVYDIHSPTVPSTDEITHFIDQALKVLPAGQLWVNPDCGLKTRRAPEVAAALDHMVAAAHSARLPAPRLSVSGPAGIRSFCALNETPRPRSGQRRPDIPEDRTTAMKLSHVPLRVVTGAYILHAGLEKWGGDEDRAKAIHGMAAGTYPVLESLPPTRFLRLLAAGEIATGAALLAPFVSTATAGAALTGFSGALLGLYAKTPGMRKPGSIWPTPQGTPISKDVWMVAIGLALLADAVTDRKKNT